MLFPTLHSVKSNYDYLCAATRDNSTGLMTKSTVLQPKFCHVAIKDRTTNLLIGKSTWLPLWGEINPIIEPVTWVIVQVIGSKWWCGRLSSVCLSVHDDVDSAQKTSCNVEIWQAYGFSSWVFAQFPPNGAHIGLMVHEQWLCVHKRVKPALHSIYYVSANAANGTKAVRAQYHYVDNNRLG